MNRLRTLFICYLSVLGAANVQTNCYKCISNYIVNHWENLHLSRVVYDLIGDNTCNDPSYKHLSSRCEGTQCATFIILGAKDGQNYTFGTLRDCANSTAFKRFKQEMADVDVRYEFDLSTTITKFTRRAVFEICNDAFCNGSPKQKGHFEARTSDASSIFRSTVSTFFFIFQFLSSVHIL
ncbi:hypothetical protein M3Y98_00140400 [Aphelenchoides besseyi]|nr:hypothetical protein M3Y98_00140400 [Aphelenchoides besseyi]KAI6199696.1 hypothetical protein M3Y96_00654200 [Aphelenchoides besseyi]